MNLRGGGDDLYVGTDDGEVAGAVPRAAFFIRIALPHALVPALFGARAGSHAVDVIGADLHPWPVNRGESCLTSHFSPKAEVLEF